MEDRNKKIFITFFWGFVLLLVISIVIWTKPYRHEKTAKATPSVQTAEIPEDGSENNPYIKGVQ